MHKVHQRYTRSLLYIEDVPLVELCTLELLACYLDGEPQVELMYLVFTRMPGESYLKRVRSLLLCLFNVSRVLTPSFVVFISWSVLLQKWIGTSNYKTMCILPWLTVVWPFLSFFSFSFLSIVCVYKKFLSAAFCRAHCALDLAKDHAP